MQPMQPMQPSVPDLPLELWEMILNKSTPTTVAKVRGLNKEFKNLEKTSVENEIAFLIKRLGLNGVYY